MCGRAYSSGVTRDDAECFAADWLAAWNAHDLDAIIEHYDEDVVFSSPFAVEANRPGGACAAGSGQAVPRHLGDTP